MAPNYTTAMNLTDGPVVIDPDGRTLGGGEWGAVDLNCDEVPAAVGDERLAILPDLDAEPGQNPHAVAAQARTEELRRRAGVLAQHDAEALARMVAEHLGDGHPSLSTDDSGVTRAERRHAIDALARSALDDDALAAAPPPPEVPDQAVVDGHVVRPDQAEAPGVGDPNAGGVPEAPPRRRAPAPAPAEPAAESSGTEG